MLTGNLEMFIKLDSSCSFRLLFRLLMKRMAIEKFKGDGSFVESNIARNSES